MVGSSTTSNSALLGVAILPAGTSSSPVTVGAITQDYTGYDLLVVANLSSFAVQDPMVSVDGGALTHLQIVGANGAAENLDALGAGQVWVTLIPDTSLATYNGGDRI